MNMEKPKSKNERKMEENLMAEHETDIDEQLRIAESI